MKKPKVAVHKNFIRLPHSQQMLAIGFVVVFVFLGIHSLMGGRAATGVPVGTPSYIDPNQVLTGGVTSFYDQPWRGWLETPSATKMLDGIGVNYNPGNISPAQDDTVLHYLSSIGVHVVRISIGWDGVDPNNENQLTPAITARFNDIFADCKKYGIKPTLTLDANDQSPEPHYTNYSANLVGSPKDGDSQVTVSGVAAANIVVHQPNTVTGSSAIYGGGGAYGSRLITSMTDNHNGTLTLGLSQPLAADLSGKISILYFKYLPLYPVGTPEFNNTMAGWMNYVKLVTNLVTANGINKFDVEIWNELSFGSAFLSINSYYDGQPWPTASGPSTQQAGGNKWELANQTTQYIKNKYGNNVNVIWGYTNSCSTCGSSSDRPPQTDGESYHIYGTLLNNFTDHIDANSEAKLREGPYVPTIQRALPEGVLILGYDQQNPLVHKMSPDNRNAHLPPDTTNFLHYMTEDGFSPGGTGHALDKAGNQFLKAKAFIRAYGFWLNKGLDQYDLYATFAPAGHLDNDGGFNLLAAGSNKSGSPVTQQSEVLGNFTHQFSGATTINQPRSLGVEVTDITPNDNTDAYNVFPADPSTGEPSLNYRQMFQFLPYQVSDNKFVISTYVMSWNIYTSPPPMDFEVDVKNVDGNHATASYYDPVLDQNMPITVVSRSGNDMVLDIESVDYPRTITIDESGGGPVNPPPDTTPPTTQLNSGPAIVTSNTTATFTFSGSDDVSAPSKLSFLCQLDQQAYSPCSSPKTYGSLSIGVHSFNVKAVDEAGNIATAPASKTWTVTGAPILTGDLDGDSHVTGHDLSILLAHYGQNYPPAEFDGGSVVNGHDLSILMSNYGK